MRTSLLVPQLLFTIFKNLPEDNNMENDRELQILRHIHLCNSLIHEDLLDQFNFVNKYLYLSVYIHGPLLDQFIRGSLLPRSIWPPLSGNDTFI